MNAVQVSNTNRYSIGCGLPGRGMAGRGLPGRALAVLLAAGASVSAVLGAAERVMAQPANGSGIDFRGEVPRGPQPFHIQTAYHGTRYWIDDGLDVSALPVAGSCGDCPIDIGAIAFFTVGSGGLGDNVVQVTTVYGIDTSPTAPLPRLTGFTQTGPRIVPIGVETITSRNGISYTSGPRINVPISGIANFLPGHDLSWFAGANPSSSVFAFQTIAPLSEIYIGSTTPPCTADVSGDGTVDGNDFTAFINSFGAGDVTVDAVADVNGDSVIDGGDFIAFINAFSAGC